MRDYDSDSAGREPSDSEGTMTCRCEEIWEAEIAAAIAAGARTVDDVKRRTRAGMGVCQGIFCVPAIAVMLAQTTGTPIERIGPMTARPPVRPIPLEAVADLRQWDSDRHDMSGSDAR